MCPGPSREARRSRKPSLRELAAPWECHQHVGSQARHPMPRLGAPSATVLTAHLIYHCTLVKTCHLLYHPHSPAWGRARRVPLLNHSFSPAESECLSAYLCLHQSPSCGRKTETSEVRVSGCHHRSPELPIFQLTQARAEEGGSQGNSWVSLAPTSSSPPSWALPAWSALLGQDQNQPANYLSKGLRLGAVPI